MNHDCCFKQSHGQTYILSHFGGKNPVKFAVEGSLKEMPWLPWLHPIEFQLQLFDIFLDYPLVNVNIAIENGDL